MSNDLNQQFPYSFQNHLPENQQEQQGLYHLVILKMLTNFLQINRDSRLILSI